MWRVHRHIGMGGDQLVAAVAGKDVEERLGDDLRSAARDEFAPLRDECEPLEGARELIDELKGRGFVVVLASSSNVDDLEHFVDLLGVGKIVDDWTTSDDVERTKPEPDLVAAAVAKAGGGPAVMVGDSTWDCEAAKRAKVETIGVRTGGFSEQELRDAGAVCVFRHIEDLIAELDSTPLAV